PTRRNNRARPRARTRRRRRATRALRPEMERALPVLLGPSSGGTAQRPIPSFSATRLPEIYSQARGFASQPHDWFAFVGARSAHPRSKERPTAANRHGHV